MNAKRPSLVFTLCILAIGHAGIALSQVIPLANAPLLTSNSANVKPNLQFVLDESGSMDWDFLPDWLNYHTSSDWTITAVPTTNGIGQYCKGTGTGRALCCRSSSNASQCMDVSGNNTPVSRRGEVPFTTNDFNGVYYNPTITYTPPLMFDGTPYPSFTTYTAVPVDGIYVSPATKGTQNAYTMNLTAGYPDLEYCTDTSYANCLRSDNYLLPGTIFGSAYTTAHMTDVSHANNLSSTTADYVSGSIAAPTITTRVLGPYYYIIVPGEYCTTKKLTNCTTSNGPTGGYIYPARLRWCNSAALTTCQALRTSTYQFPRYPTLVLANFAYASDVVTAAVSQNATFTISSIKAGGTELLAASIVCSGSSATCNTSSATAATRNRAVATAIQSAINANSAASTFGADANGTAVTISAPAGTAYNGATLRINNGTSGVANAGLTFSNNFNSNGTSSGSAVPGSFKRIDIAPGQTYGNLWIDATGALFTSGGMGRTLVLDRSTRTDCSASSCTYAQEMTNFANWYAYYHTRMQMMKSSLSRAFASLPNNKYRVGLFTINSSAFGNATITKSITGSAPNRYSSNEFLDIAPWDDTQREYWYNTLFKINPSGGTPLREGLAHAGQIYAHMLKGANDVMEESCQQNFTLLSTDGYWNGNGGVRITGGSPSSPTTSSMNDQDGGLEPPYKDGKGVADTLADTAAFYYNTDLRQSAWNNCTSGATGHDVCTNDVKGSQPQSMVTFTLGLGANGVMQYRDNYPYPPSTGDLPDDYSAVSATTTANSSSGVCLWQASGTCTWPAPASDRQENIDDLWHAAVNGHGIYYSARNPAELTAGLASALATVSIQLGSASAATTSSPNISRNDNFAFSTTYTTGDWTGDLFLQTIDTTTGLLSPTKVWSAVGNVDGINAATRKVWMLTSDTATYSSKLKPFQWAALTATDTTKPCGDPADEQACFSSPYINGLSQFCSTGVDCLDAAAQASASGANLVSYLRGDKTNETTLYRARKHLLGDVVDSEAVYVQNSLYPWSEAKNPGYGAFMQNNFTRSGAVYVSANDGMLHAFDASNGVERWAYVPSMVLPGIYQLADKNYSHLYFVDGTPVTGDAFINGAWSTLLVGGLNAGGAGYFALDITNPGNPRGLWEFKRRTSNCSTGTFDDCDLGFSYSNPVITKYCTGWNDVTSTGADGTPLNGTCTTYTWAVLVTSGYNNVSSGDGKGYLYVLNAATGQILKKLSTGSGSTALPSNLGRIEVWRNDGRDDNVATTAYAGDMQGNLWRFNLVNGTVSKLAAFGPTRPITAKPVVGLVDSKYRVVYVPTGRLLSNSAPYDDTNLTATQGFYAVWDKNDGATTWMPPSNFVQAPVSCTASGTTLGDCTATTASSVFDGSHGGWYLDFSGNGERGYTDPDLSFGVIIFTTGSPLGSGCSPSGSGRLWALDYASGGLVAGATKAATALGYMPPRPVTVSMGGHIEVIEGNAGGTGGSAVVPGSGLVFGVANSGSLPKAPRHAIWRVLPN